MEPDLEIGLLKEEDQYQALAILEEARASFKAQGIDQWQGDYPGLEDIIADRKAGQGLVLKKGSLVLATAALCPGPDPTYGVIDGAWRWEGPYGVIHRLAVSQAHKGRGLATYFVNALAGRLLSQGIDLIRTDTHRDNHAMQALIRTSGFSYAGVIRLEDGSPRLAYERKLDI